MVKAVHQQCVTINRSRHYRPERMALTAKRKGRYGFDRRKVQASTAMALTVKGNVSRHSTASALINVASHDAASAHPCS
eukprot:816555-Pelagomonas_calceolata.AAC.3